MAMAELMVKLGLRNTCPVCGKPLIDVGYQRGFIQRIKCEDRECGWGWA